MVKVLDALEIAADNSEPDVAFAPLQAPDAKHEVESAELQLNLTRLPIAMRDSLEDNLICGAAVELAAL
jgi:hypothetical protein